MVAQLGTRRNYDQREMSRDEDDWELEQEYVKYGYLIITFILFVWLCCDVTLLQSPPT